MSLQPSPQQSTIIDYTETGNSVCVLAGAGSGKSSTERMIAERNSSRRFLYTALARSVIDSATGRMPPNVLVKGMHQLAYRAKGAALQHKNNPGGKWSFRRALKDRFEQAYSRMGGDESRTESAYDHTLDVFFTFLNSADEYPHPTYLKGRVKDPELVELYVRLAHRVWLACSDPNDPAPSTHDVYLKAFALSRPRLPFDAIEVDEAQDFSPVMLSIIEPQPCQKIYVGDPNQAIFGFRGAINTFGYVPHGRLPLTGCYRFGPQAAELANTCLAFEPGTFRLQGLGGNTIVKTGDPTAADGVVARSNGTLIAEAIRVVTSGRKIHFYGGLDEALDLLVDMYQFRATKITKNRAIRDFTDWDQLEEAVETPYARELRPYFKLVEEYADKVPAVCDKLRSSHVGLERADVRFGTVHKFKGGEVDHIYVAGDFGDIYEQESLKSPVTYSSEAMHLAYVAVTRGRQVVTVAQGFVDMLQTSADLALGAGLLSDSPLRHLPDGLQRRDMAPMLL